MDITAFLTGVTSSITNQTAPGTISPTTVGGKFTDLANLTKTSVEAVAAQATSTQVVATGATATILALQTGLTSTNLIVSGHTTSISTLTTNVTALQTGLTATNAIVTTQGVSVGLIPPMQNSITTLEAANEIVTFVGTGSTGTSQLSNASNWVSSNILIPANTKLKTLTFYYPNAIPFSIILFNKVGTTYTVIDIISVTPVIGLNTITVGKTYTTDVYVGCRGTFYYGAGGTLSNLGTTVLTIGTNVAVTSTATGGFLVLANYVSGTNIANLLSDDTLVQNNLFKKYTENVTSYSDFTWYDGTFASTAGYASYIFNNNPVSNSAYISTLTFGSTVPTTDVITSIQIIEIVAGVINVKFTYTVAATVSYSGSVVTQVLTTPIYVEKGQYIAVKGSGVIYTSTPTGFSGRYWTGTAWGASSANAGIFLTYTLADYVGIKDKLTTVAKTLASFGAPTTLGNVIKRDSNKKIKYYDFPFTSGTTEWTVPTAWTVANGYATTTTLNSKLICNRRFISDKRTIRASVTFKADTILYIGGLVSATEVYTRCVINLQTNTLQILQQIVTTNVIASVANTIPITPDIEYIIEMERNSRVTTIRLIDPRTAAKVEISHDYVTGSNYGNGAGNHRPNYFFELIGGSGFSLKWIKVFGLYKPHICFTGDSITEANGRCDKNYAESLLEQFGDNGGIVAQSGQLIDTLITSLTNEIVFMKPRFLSVKIGTNGVPTAAQFQTVIDFCTANSIELILNNVVCRSPAEDHIAKNALIQSYGIQGALFDFATAISNYPFVDGTHPSPRANPSYYNSDGTHPNQAGNDAMVIRFNVDLPVTKSY